MEYIKIKTDDFFHISRVALSGRTQDVSVLLHRVAKRNSTDPKIAKMLIDLLRERSTPSSFLRRTSEVPIPVDSDSRFQLLRVEEEPLISNEPVYAKSVQERLEQLVSERLNASLLLDAHLEPTRTVLFTGPAGVGKTLAARWLARETKLPLLTLDLSAVMSSYLGRTGSNLRNVLDYAKSINCVILLDELDAIAKRRDDFGEIGELKRLVTVLLQQLDDWPSSGFLIAATNHSELLDPAVWRRFEQLIEFPLPDRKAIKTFVFSMLRDAIPDADIWSDTLSIGLSHLSFSDIEQRINLARRAMALSNGHLSESLPSLLSDRDQSKQTRIDLAVSLVEEGIASQRKAHELTGVSREAIRKRTKSPVNPGVKK